MRAIQTALYLVRHLYWVGRSGQVRFRLETFGLYYPTLPYDAPWWRVNPGSLLLLIRRLPEYIRWVAEMEELRRHGPDVWWSRHRRDAGTPENGF
jgi:hypothetical protein